LAAGIAGLALLAFIGLAGAAAMNEFIPDKKAYPVQPPPDGVGGFGA
jgi:hypothetical protein